MIRTGRPLGQVLAIALALAIAFSAMVQAQTTKTPSAPAAPPFKLEQLEQIVSPIALYPDALLAQIFMASTYPLEVVEAARFAKQNAKLKGAALNEALKSQTWDDSVKSLVSVPQVLAMMNDKLDWTQKLGDAVLAEQKELMAAVQRLRAKAQAAGHLQSNTQQKVIVEPAEPPAPGSTTVAAGETQTIIKIEPANPQIVYVPAYPPTVYGVWPYPAYPPAPYYPAGAMAATAAISFGVGMAVGASMYGACNWSHGNVNVNVNNYSSFTNNVNTANVAKKNTTNVQGSGNTWQHDPQHRQGTQYRDAATQQQFNKNSINSERAQARQAFSGHNFGGDGFGGGGGGFGGGGGGFGGGSGGFGGGGGGGAFDGIGHGGDASQFSARGDSSLSAAHGGGFGGGGFGEGGGGGFGGGRFGGGGFGGFRGRR